MKDWLVGLIQELERSEDDDDIFDLIEIAGWVRRFRKGGKAGFKDIKNQDYRIKDFSPGFNATSDRKSMGAFFNEALQLRDDLR